MQANEKENPICLPCMPDMLQTLQYTSRCAPEEARVCVPGRNATDVTLLRLLGFGL